MFRQPGLSQIRARRVGDTTGGGEVPLTFTSGLTRNVNTVTNDLITGKAGGQLVVGGTAAGENLTLQSTTNATRGLVVVNDPASFPTNGSQGTPTITVGTATDKAGFHNAGGILAFDLGGSIGAYLTATGLNTNVPLQVGVAGNAAAPALTLNGLTTGLYFFTTGLGISVAGTSVMTANGTTVNVAALASFTPPASTGGQTTKFAISPAADTGTVFSSEAIDVHFQLNRTRTWATGAIATQRSFVVQPPTLAFVGASTVTTAATVAISGAPVAGANATITNAYSLWVQAGTTSLDGGTFTPTVTGGTGAAQSLTLQSTSNATRGGINLVDPVGVGRTVSGIGPPQFAVAGNMTIGSSAGSTLDWFIVNAPTITITGGTNITTATGFNLVSIEPPTYSTTVTIGAGGTTPAAATLVIKGAPSITGGGAFAGVGQVGLWVQNANVQFDGQITIGTGFSLRAATGAVIMGPNGLDLNSNSCLLNLPFRIALGGGAAATLGTVGGSGPATAAQNGWVQIQVQGTNSWFPIWR